MLLSFFPLLWSVRKSDVLKVKNTASLSHPGASTRSPSELSHPLTPTCSCGLHILRLVYLQ